MSPKDMQFGGMEDFNDDFPIEKILSEMGRLSRLGMGIKETDKKSIKSNIHIMSVLPKHQEKINGDDILNLKILLGTCKTIDEFISKI
jgi:hypothetical protein